MFEVNERAKRYDTEQQNLRALQMRTRVGSSSVENWNNNLLLTRTPHSVKIFATYKVVLLLSYLMATTKSCKR